MAQNSNYWFSTCPTKHTTSSGLIRNADVLIIGGGITGLSLLFQLLVSGISNTYLVDEASVGFHGSGRGSGQLMLRGAKLFSKMPEQKGVEYLNFIDNNNKKFVKSLRVVKFDTDLRECGGLRLAINDEELADLKIEAQFLNDYREIKCTILDQEFIKYLMPDCGFVGGMFVPTEITFNPYKIINGLRELIELNGSRVLTNSCVESVTANNDGTLNVAVRHKGTIRAKHVVYCNDAYIPELVPELIPILTSYRGQMLATDHLPEETINKFPQMSMSCHDGNEYFRLYGSRLLVGGMRHAVRGHQVGIINDSDISPAVNDKLRNFVNEALPCLGDVKFLYSWSGIMCSTPDGLPLIGKLPNRVSQYVFGGFGNYGFSHSIQGSILIKDLIIKGESNSSYIKLFDPERFLCN